MMRPFLCLAECSLRRCTAPVTFKSHTLRYSRSIRYTSNMSKIVDTVKSTVAENFGGAAHSVADKEHQFSIEEVPDLTGKIAVVTGGSEGIGYGVTHTFMSRNIEHLYILSLSQEVVDGSINAMKEELGTDVSKKVTWIQCDMANWHRVTEVANQISKSTSRIDILVNNAARGKQIHVAMPIMRG